VDFLLVLIELFSLGVTAEELRANIRSKSVISLERGGGPVDPKFQAEGVAKKVKLTIIGSPLGSMRFPVSPRQTSYVVPKPPKGGLKRKVS